MLNIIVKSLYSFFLIYGIWHFVVEIKNMILRKNDSSEDLAVVIKTKNSEKTLEATVRTIICKILKDTKQSHVPDIIIVDFGSDDSTCEIGKKLAQDYSFVYFTTYDIYEKCKKQ